MADTRREKILKYVVGTSCLEASGKPQGVTIHRYRRRALENDDLPAIVVYPTQDPRGDRTQGANGSAVKRILRLRCELRATGDQPDEELDPLYSWTVRQVLADTTLGGLARAVDEVTTQWAHEAMNLPYGAAAVDFDIEYWTNLQNPETAA